MEREEKDCQKRNLEHLFEESLCRAEEEELRRGGLAKRVRWAG